MEETYTITESEAEKIIDALCKLQRKVQSGDLSPNETANKILLINYLFGDTIDNKLNK